MWYYSWIEAIDYFRYANNEKAKARGDYFIYFDFKLSDLVDDKN